MGDRDTLFDMIYAKSFQYTTDIITLSSGRKTNYYFDLKQITGNPVGINLAGKLLYEKIKQLDNINSVGGLESGSISISTIISSLSDRQNESKVASFYVRKNAKSHGLGKQVEGVVISPTVIVDDVITTAGSALKAVHILKEMDIEIKSLLSIVYRGTKDDMKQLEQNNNIPIHTLFFEQEFIERYDQRQH